MRHEQDRPKIVIATSVTGNTLPVPSRTAAVLAGCAQREEFSAEVIDAGRVNLVEAVRKSQPLFTGLSVMLPGELLELDKITRQIRQAAPNTIIGVGGSPVTLQTAETFRSAPEIDLIFRGISDRSWRDFLALLKSGIRRENIFQISDDYPGICRPSGDLTISPYLPLRMVNPPDYSRLSPGLSSYFHSGGTETSWFEMYKHKQMLDVLTHIGCYYGCVFCFNTQLQQLEEGTGRPKVEFRPPAQVADEIEEVVERLRFETIPVYLAGVNCFADPDNLEETVRILLERGLDRRVRMNCDSIVKHLLHADKKKPQLLELCCHAGLRYIKLGVEHLHHDMQKYIRKIVSPDEISQAVTRIWQAGIVPELEFVLGLPPETSETLQFFYETILRLKKELPPFIIQVHRAVPFAGTDLHDEVIESRLLGRDNHIPSKWFGGACMPTRSLTAEEVSRGIWRIMSAFYSDGYLSSLEGIPGEQGELVRFEASKKISRARELLSIMEE